MVVSKNNGNGRLMESLSNKKFRVDEPHKGKRALAGSREESNLHWTATATLLGKEWLCITKF